MRRRLLIAVVVLVTLAAVPASAAQTRHDRVVTYQAGFGHTGSVTGSGVAPPLHEVWSTPTYGSGTFPVTSNGVVYLASSDEVSAIELATGRPLWERTISMAGVTGLDVGNGLVHVLTGACAVLALDPDDGDTVWLDAGWNHAAGDCTGGPVTRHGLTVYSTRGGEYPHHLVALDARTGEPLWRRRVGAEAVAPPVITRDRIILSSGLTVALDLEGRRVWRQECCPGGGTSGGPQTVVSGGLVYIGVDGAALDVDTGDRVSTVASGYLSAVGQGHVVAVQSDRVVASDLQGRPTWTVPLDEPRGVTPIIVDGVAYVETFDDADAGPGRLYALDLDTGVLLWQTTIDNPSAIEDHGLAVADGLLLVPEDGALHAFAPDPVG